MTNVWSRIAAFSQRYPLSRGMASYACIWPVGSLVQQTIQGKETYDYWRAVRFSLYGCCFVAPTLYTWMTIASWMFPKPGFRSGLSKRVRVVQALVEQVTYTPSAMICFYFFMTLLEGGTLDQACDEVKSKFWPTYQVGACVWPVLQTFNFTVVPPNNRVPFAIIEQVTYGPFAITCFYFGMTLLEGGTVDDAVKEVKSKMLPTWQVGMCVWPVVQTINFTIIPEKNRVPFVSVCSVMWTTFLAYMKQRQQKQQTSKLNHDMPSG